MNADAAPHQINELARYSQAETSAVERGGIVGVGFELVEEGGDFLVRDTGTGIFNNAEYMAAIGHADFDGDGAAIRELQCIA